MTMLKFARDLASFEEHLSWAAHGGGDGRESAIARSYLAILGELDELDEYVGTLEEMADDKGRSGRISEILAAAIEVFNDCQSEAAADADHATWQREAECAEAVRRHELAVTVECPYCGAAPGLVCRTAGPSGMSYPKGVHDHLVRWRLATAGAP